MRQYAPDRIVDAGQSHKSIQYQFQTKKETISNYFKIIEESNSQLLTPINKYSINTGEYFPIFGFSLICDQIDNVSKLKEQQRHKLKNALDSIHISCQSNHDAIHKIIDDNTIALSNKVNAVLWSILNDKVLLNDSETFLKNFPYENRTDFRKVLCAYDMKRYRDV